MVFLFECVQHPVINCLGRLAWHTMLSREGAGAAVQHGRLPASQDCCVQCSQGATQKQIGWSMLDLGFQPLYSCSLLPCLARQARARTLSCGTSATPTSPLTVWPHWKASCNRCCLAAAAAVLLLLRACMTACITCCCCCSARVQLSACCCGCCPVCAAFLLWCHTQGAALCCYTHDSPPY